LTISAGTSSSRPRNAKAAGLSAPYVSEIEGGMKKLAEALKVDLDDLV